VQTHREEEGRVGDLKGQVTEVYSCLLAQLRWCFVELEQVWLHFGLLSASGDIFSLMKFGALLKVLTWF